MLEVDGVTKRLGGRVILDRVSVACAPSEVVVVAGENGAGKSTLLRVIAGIVEPDRGEVRIGGEALSGGAASPRRHLGYVPDATDALPDLTVSELMTLVAALKGVRVARRGELRSPRDRYGELRSRLGLEDVWTQRLSALSFGQRKRACVLAALIGDPWLLVLDEPSNGLDPGATSVIAELIAARRAEEKGTVLTTNDPVFAERVSGARHELKGGALRRVAER